MTLTRTKPILIVTGLTAALALTGCAGSASQKESEAGERRRRRHDRAADVPRPRPTRPSVDWSTTTPTPPSRSRATWLYEPLIVRNNLTCEETPWLATKATWEGGDKLTFDIREGVKWSDGTALHGQGRRLHLQPR